MAPPVSFRLYIFIEGSRRFSSMIFCLYFVWQKCRAFICIFLFRFHSYQFFVGNLCRALCWRRKFSDIDTCKRQIHTMNDECRCTKPSCCATIEKIQTNRMCVCVCVYSVSMSILYEIHPMLEFRMFVFGLVFFLNVQPHTHTDASHTSLCVLCGSASWLCEHPARDRWQMWSCMLRRFLSFSSFCLLDAPHAFKTVYDTRVMNFNYFFRRFFFHLVVDAMVCVRWERLRYRKREWRSLRTYNFNVDAFGSSE